MEGRQHRVPAHSALGETLAKLRLRRFERLLPPTCATSSGHLQHQDDADAPLARGRWCAEHAVSTLAQPPTCDSPPSWIVWIGDEPPSNDKAPLVVALWAADARAGYRCLLALRLADLVQLGRPIAVFQHCGGPIGEQLERYARLYDDVEYEPITSSCGAAADLWALAPSALDRDGDSLRPYEAWGVLWRRDGDELARLCERRTQQAGEDAALARRRLEELSALLLARDPLAKMDVATVEGRQGAYEVSVRGTFKDEHAAIWCGIVDSHADPALLVGLISTSCVCC